ncbi:hypothetical protein [Fodinicola feengrottensis]|uniref:Uncharacterized protein n=1 Tax=Fodinicola feengrottensis TaxID=435914 RepID=A0ABP4V1P8_9ACTN|nr:hypothetical protein [Fodinicola feengrottensis]
MTVEGSRTALARQLLAQLGVSIADLLNDESAVLVLPTFADYLPRVIAAAGPGANRSYWRPLAVVWGDRRLDRIYASDIEAMQHTAAASARSRPNRRHGRHAGEHVIAAARAVYNRAIADGIVAPGLSLAHRVTKARRLPSTRRAPTDSELEQINLAARSSGNDGILDALFCGCTPEPRADAGEPSVFACQTWMLSVVWCSCGRKAAGSFSVWCNRFRAVRDVLRTLDATSSTLLGS